MLTSERRSSRAPKPVTLYNDSDFKREKKGNASKSALVTTTATAPKTKTSELTSGASDEPHRKNKKLKKGASLGKKKSSNTLPDNTSTLQSKNSNVITTYVSDVDVKVQNSGSLLKKRKHQNKKPFKYVLHLIGLIDFMISYFFCVMNCILSF